MDQNTRDPRYIEIARLEALYKLLYFVRDLGIRSAHEPAKHYWLKHADATCQLMVGG